MDGKKHPACINVPKTIPRSPGHDREWFDAMKQGKPELAYSRFEIAGYLTESILLGCIALRVGVGKTHGMGRQEHEVHQPARGRPVRQPQEPQGLGSVIQTRSWKYLRSAGPVAQAPFFSS